MTKQKLDKATSKALKMGDEIKEVLQTPGWVHIKKKIVDYIIDVQSVRNVSGKTSEDVLVDVRARLTVVNMLQAFLNDIEARVDQYETNSELMKEVVEENSYIVR